MNKTAVKKKAPAKKISKKVNKKPKISLMVAILRAVKVKSLSAPKIAKSIKISVALVYLGIADLENQKLVASKLDESGGRGRKGNVFFLTPEGMEEIKIIG